MVLNNIHHPQYMTCMWDTLFLWNVKVSCEFSDKQNNMQLAQGNNNSWKL